MKYFSYILSIVFLVLISCGSHQENTKVKNQKESQDSVIRQRFDKKILIKTQEEAREKAPYTQKDLDELASQKIQQYFEMLNIIKHGKQQDSFKKYTEKYARKLWLNPKKEPAFSQKNSIITADSLKIDRLILQNLKENNPQELIGTYRLSYKVFKNGKALTQKTDAKIYFEIIDLNLNGEIYQTLKAKILGID